MATATKLPRGVRNNNPGNIDRNATKWQGMKDDQSGDARFVVFKSPEWGIRALARTLMTYQSQHRLDTIRKIISRWAPPNENDTGAYVTAVARRVGVDPDAKIDLDTMEVMAPLVTAIISHETAGYAYPDNVVAEGLHLAGISDSKPKPLARQGSFVAQAATGVSVAGAAAAQYAPQVKSAADQIADFTGAPIIAHVSTILLTVAGLLTMAGIVAAWMKQKAS